MAHLGTRCRNSCVVAGDPRQTTFFQVTDADALQAEALRLIRCSQKPEIEFDISNCQLWGFPNFGPGTSVYPARGATFAAAFPPEGDRVIADWKQGSSQVRTIPSPPTHPADP